MSTDGDDEDEWGSDGGNSDRHQNKRVPLHMHEDSCKLVLWIVDAVDLTQLLRDGQRHQSHAGKND